MKSSGVGCDLPPPIIPQINGDLLRMLSDPGADVNTSLSTEGYCLNVVFYAHLLLNAADGVVLHWYSPETNTLVPYSVFGNTNSVFPSLKMKPGQGNAGRVYLEKTTRMISDTETCADFIFRHKSAYKVRSIISAPVMHEDTCCGVLSVHNSTLGGFSQQDKEWLEKYSFLAATFHAIVRAYNEENDNRAWAEALADASAAMANSLDPQEVLNAILEQVGRVLPARGQDILLVDGNEAYLVGQHGYDIPDLSKRVCLPISVSPLKHMLETGTPFISQDVTKIVDWISVDGVGWVRSYASIPLMRAKKVIGFLNVTSDEPDRFDDEMLRRLKTFGDHASIALENAHLHSELKGALRHETLMREKMILNENLASMGKVVSLVAHALNNPLQAIMNSLYLLEQEISPDSPAREVVDIANSDINRLTNLVLQLRQAYQPDQELRQCLSLSSIIENVNALILPQLPDRHIIWHCRMVPATYQVDGIPGQLMKAFLNIVLNAIEAMEGKNGGDLVLDWQIKPETSQIGVSIKDSGAGILEEDMERIFNPYYSTKDTKIGLGLVTTEQIIRQHDGWIDVQSVPGKETKFTVWLPLANTQTWMQDHRERT